MQKKKLRSSAAALALLAALALSACGGGGGGDSEPAPTVTAIPANIAITAPATADMASALQFTSGAGSLSGLKYSWDFGDGTTSTDAAPSHSYAKGGDFKVTLHVTNEAGASADAQYGLSINNTGLVQGLSCSGAKQTGWCWEQPLPSGADRYDTFFIDANTGWSVGANGTILKTVDGGATWQGQVSGVTVGIRMVRFANASKGWAQADYGALLQTSDGGATWSVSKVATDYSAGSLQVFDANTVLLKDSSGNVLSSKDGGQTWQTSPVMPTQISKGKVMWTLTNGVLSKSTDFGVTQVQVLNAQATGTTTFYSTFTLQRMDDQHLLVSRSSQGYVNNNYVYTTDYWRSQDGGATWDTPAMQGLPVIPSGYSLSFLYAGPGALFASINSTVYRSDDVGGSWSVVNAPFASGYYYGSSLYTVSDTQLIYYQYNTAYISTDNGKTWSAMTIPGSSGSYSYYYGPSGVQSVGAQSLQLNFSDGSTFRSADLGKTWTAILSPTVAPSASQLRAFWAFDAKHALGVDSNGDLMESKDGGLSWRVKQSGLYASSSPWISFASAKVGWLFLGDGHLYRSTDGGETWAAGLSSNFSNYYGLNFQFVDENLGFVVNSGRLSQTKDGGNSWLDVGLMPSNSSKVRFQSATHGLAFGYSGMFETSDGGLTWVPRFTGYTATINAAVYSDAKTAWAVDSSGNLLKSGDAGTTWQRIALPIGNTALYAIQFLDANRGWISGANGAVVATSDGGKTWQAQTVATGRTLQLVQFVDSRTGWLLGDNGALLTTGTGGN